jgi:methionyl-tRNA synthetase
VNSELVAVFGNYVNRTWVLMHKLCGGKVPRLHEEIIDDADRQMMEQFALSAKEIADDIEHYRFRDGLFKVIDLARKGNKYMQDKEPWIKAKNVDGMGNPVAEAQKQIDNCLHICLQCCANLAILANPYLPNTAKKMLHMMKVVEKMLEWENAGKTKLLSVGYSLRAPELLFRKIDDAEVTAQIEKLQKAEAAASAGQPSAPAAITYAEQKAEIVYDDFAKLDLRVGKVLHAEKVEKADKLLKLEVDLGYEKRTVVSGIAMHYRPEEIIGKQVVVVANLAPRKMRGIESKGMILMAEDASGKLHFINPEEEPNPGATVS